MRLVGRNDLVLLGGLAVALFVVFSEALAELVGALQEIDEHRGLRLLPALVILGTVFAFHQLRKRYQMQFEAATASTAARQATARAAEMERLVAFGQALARSLRDDSLQGAVAAHVPLLAPGRGAWVLARTPTHWKTLMVVGDSSSADRERDARLAIGDPDRDAAAQPAAAAPAFACFPMIAGDEPLGVLGVAADPPLHDEQRRIFSTAAALLAVSLKNAELFREIREHSVHDALTGCFNRRHALDVIDAELRRARRSHMPLSLVMFDLDHFKDVNDRLGHLAGDAVLAAVGARMRAVLRGSDLKCRYGGEEFLILLPDTGPSGAERAADMLRREIERHPVTWNDELIPVTASFGVTGITPGELDPLAVMARADAALYRAKEDGRNCVRVASETEALT